MLYDGGALKPYREKSSIFRFIRENARNRDRHYDAWPMPIRMSLGIFIRTPGVARAWVARNFKLYNSRQLRIWHYAARWDHLVPLNLASITEQDTIEYLRYSVNNQHIPFWAKPFILDDVKRGMTIAETARKYGITDVSVHNVKKGDFSHVFRPRTLPRWWENVGR